MTIPMLVTLLLFDKIFIHIFGETNFTRFAVANLKAVPISDKVLVSFLSAKARVATERK